MVFERDQGLNKGLNLEKGGGSCTMYMGQALCGPGPSVGPWSLLNSKVLQILKLFIYIFEKGWFLRGTRDQIKGLTK